MVTVSNPGISKPEFAMGLLELSRNMMNRFDQLEKKFNEQKEMNRKLILLISQLYKDGVDNQDTLNKLDKFLEEYYEQPYFDNP